jgi:hypothetical protein
MAEYQKLFKSFNNNTKKIQKLSRTRWLARYGAISTILSQWLYKAYALHTFFKERQEDKSLHSG